jgi:hypothetical protein
LEGDFKSMKKRVRNVPILFFVDEKEAGIIKEKAKISELNKSQYLRKMAVDGFILKQDIQNINSLIYEINKIGVNVNQITKLANEIGGVNTSEIIEVKKKVNNIWQLLKSNLLNQH